MEELRSHHPPTPSSKEDGESVALPLKAPSSLEEGVGDGAPTRQTLLKRAAEMRRNPTEPERRMWMQLRDRRFAHFKFRRQAVMAPRIVDFFCPAKGLVIEIDGHTHDAEQDAARDRALEGKTGFRVIRFTNEDVMRNMDGVLIALETALQSKADRWPNSHLHHPLTPSSEEEEGPVALNTKAPSSSECDQSHVPLIAVGDGGGIHNV